MAVRRQTLHPRRRRLSGRDFRNHVAVRQAFVCSRHHVVSAVAISGTMWRRQSELLLLTSSGLSGRDFRNHVAASSPHPPGRTTQSQRSRFQEPCGGYQYISRNQYQRSQRSRFQEPCGGVTNTAISIVISGLSGRDFRNHVAGQRIYETINTQPSQRSRFQEPCGGT